MARDFDSLNVGSIPATPANTKSPPSRWALCIGRCSIRIDQAPQRGALVRIRFSKIGKLAFQAKRKRIFAQRNASCQKKHAYACFFIQSEVLVCRNRRRRMASRISVYSPSDWFHASLRDDSIPQQVADSIQGCALMICNSYGIDDIHAGRDDIQSHSALMIYQVCDLDMDACTSTTIKYTSLGVRGHLDTKYPLFLPSASESGELSIQKIKNIFKIIIKIPVDKH